MPRAGELTDRADLAERFATPCPLSRDEALFEASRCLYCFDAPCTRSCPTAIDVPRFIRQILHLDDLGAARTILEANIFGGTCARACPTEVLCEGACVDRVLSGGPIPIGRLQQWACDAATESGEVFFEPGPPTGKKVAIIGSGPSGLTCAHELRKLGHEVVVFEARSIPGGLDMSGVAAYKLSSEFVAREIDRICSIGIELKLGRKVQPFQIGALLSRDQFDAIFVAVGLGRTVPLGIEGESLKGVWESLDFIEQTRLKPLEECEIGDEVIVIGGGNTAIDVATAARRLGARRVTIVYRNGQSAMPAFPFEYSLALQDGVRFEWFATPTRMVGDGDHVRGVEFARTSLDATGKLQVQTESRFQLDADMVVKALGQGPLVEWLEQVGLDHRDRRILIDPDTGATSLDRIFAGGDCSRKGGEVVDAVQDGKRAAGGIDAFLRSTGNA